MNQILLLQGVGNSEQAWARIISQQQGRVVLILRSHVIQLEVWEHGVCIHRGRKLRVCRSTATATYVLFIEPWVNLLIFGLSLWHTRGQPVAFAVGTNHDNGGIALLLRALGKVRRVAVLLCDYLPPRGPLLVRWYRRLGDALNRRAARWANEAWRVSPRISAAEENPRHFFAPLCLEDHGGSDRPRTDIAYLGHPSPDHAVDTLFEIAGRMGVRVHIIGDSPYLDTIRHLAPAETVFHGFLNDASAIDEILRDCFAGYAVYRTTGPDGYSYYGVPSKAFRYFSSNVPVVITDTADFVRHIRDAEIGRVVEPDAAEIEAVLREFQQNYSTYAENIRRFREDWNAGVVRFLAERGKALSE
jgi:glycosyltransferase involved in cell wall biosynthesis